MGNSARKYSREDSADSVPKPEVLINAFRKLLRPHRSWVLFQNGTAVVVSVKDAQFKNEEEIELDAKQFLHESGKSVVGTPLAEFDSIYNSQLGGWIVTFHTEKLLTFVPSEEKINSDSNESNSMTFGLLGRMLRQKDSRELKVIYVHKAQQ